jgi:hypothetical protein
VIVPTTSDEVRAVFSAAELAEIVARPVRLGAERTLDAAELAASWASRVEKIDRDRELPWTDRTVWNEHDLAGSLFVRDFLQEALDKLPEPVRERMTVIVDGSDERFRSYTVDDPSARTARIAEVEPVGRGWWWRRAPETGPIAEDLARY